MRMINADLIQYEPMLSAKGNGMYEDVMVAYKSQIDDLPTIEERKTGKWISHDVNGKESIDRDVCSACGERFAQIAETGCEWNYCPNCGSRMER